MFEDDRQGKPEIVARYDYADASGEVLYQAVRYMPKTFKQRRPTAKAVLDLGH